MRHPHTQRIPLSIAFLAAVLLGLLAVPSLAATIQSAPTHQTTPTIHYRAMSIDGVEVFYREAGLRTNPTILLLHGFPTSSHMFRDLIPALADKYHLIAPDYPGFGYSAMPTVEEFDYTFDRLAEVVTTLVDRLEIDRFSLYLMDYGAPIGFRMAVAAPERVDTLIIQNGNAYEEGLREFWDPFRAYWADRSASTAAPLEAFLTIGGTKWQYLTGVREPTQISPDTWSHVQPLLDRPGNRAIQLQLFYDYGSNPKHYPAWQEYFRKHQPPTLIVWGRHDPIFPAEGAHPYRRDLEKVDFNLLDTGHFALEEDLEIIVAKIRHFLPQNLGR